VFTSTDVADSTRIRLNDSRRRRYSNLQDATGDGTRVDAIDTAADYYLRMAGGTTAKPTGAVQELMRQAVQQGSVTPEEIAETLDQPELPVTAQTTFSVGEE